MSIIYKITNTTNGMVYIGRSNKTLEEAWTVHRYEGRQTRPVRLIGQAIKQFGVEHFTYETIEECNSDQLRMRHKYWMDHYQSQDKGYNKKHMGGVAVPHDILTEMHAEGMSAMEIASALGCDERTVVNHIKSDKPAICTKEVTRRYGRTSSKEAILQLWETGMAHPEIAQQLHLTEATVQNTLRKNNVSLQELYARRDLPMPAHCHKYGYAQVDMNECTMETPDSSTVVAGRHNISKPALYDACTGPRTNVSGKMFRRYDENGAMIPRMYEPVGHTVPVKCVNPDNPDMCQEFPSITAAAVALVGTKDLNTMNKLRYAASKHTLFCGMYWYIEGRDNRRRPIYAFSVTDYNVQQVFMNQSEAAIFLHVHQNAISRHLNYPQKYRSTGGYILSWDENFSREEWEEAIRYVRPANARCRVSQTKQQHIYLTDIEVYDVTYCSTLLDAIAKTQSSASVIQKCLRGELKSARKYFVTNEPITFDAWNERVSELRYTSPAKAVYGVNVDTQEIITAKSVSEAARKVSMSRHIINVALQHQRCAAGYQWHYGTPNNV